MRSIFNSSKSILRAWEAFSILRKAFSKREKHSQFFEKHSQNVGSISNSRWGHSWKPPRRHSQIWEGIFNSRRSIWKKRDISIQACVILNLHKIISNLDKKKACPKKGIINIPWRHFENAHRFGQRRHDFLSKASQVQLEKLKHKDFFSWASENNDLHVSKKNKSKNKIF